jgi:SNF2 family DNA or RNA helicase
MLFRSLSRLDRFLLKIENLKTLGANVLLKANQLPEDKRVALAEKIRTLKDIKLPELQYFNSDPCSEHETPNPACQKCGIIFRKHQKIGVAWLTVAKMGLLADSVGTGKTIQAAGVMAVMKESGEMDQGKVLVICRPAAVPQWEAQLNRLLKEVKVIVADGPKAKRQAKYFGHWDVCVMSYQMLISDLEQLDLAFNYQAVFVDDVDPLRNGDTATAYAIKRISRRSPRVNELTGTPLQKRLMDLYNVLLPLGAREVLGSPLTFERRYVVRETVNETSSTGKITTKNKIVGYKNLPEFKDKIAHLTLRRTADDIDDVDLPAIIPNNVFLDPYPAQMRKYEELRAGVLRIIKAEGAEVKRATAIAKFLYGSQICTGLAALGEPDAANTSIKLDWFEHQVVDGDLSEEKVVGFLNFKNSIRAMQARLDRAGIGYVTIWGENKSNADRFAAQQKFWNDPNCRVLLGTTSIEQSLNLQIARHLVNVDMIMNPSRMEQLAGRIRRDGSAYKSVYVHNLLTMGTQEERYLPALQREQALIDHIWDSKSELFDALSPLELLMLINGGKSA